MELTIEALLGKVLDFVTCFVVAHGHIYLLLPVHIFIYHCYDNMYSYDIKI